MADLTKLVKDVFNPQAGENVVVLNDYPSDPAHVDEDYDARKAMAEAWHEAFCRVSIGGGFTIESIITYEPTGENGAPLPQQATQDNNEIDLASKMASWGEKDIIVAISRFSATGPIFSLVEEQNFRGATMPGATMDMTAFDADYSIVAQKARILADELTAAIYGIVKFSTGHECYFDLRGREGQVDDGQCQHPGQNINLPSGESYICPYEGKQHKHTSSTDGFLPAQYGDELVVYRVENGRIVEVIGDGPKAEEMRLFFAVDSARAYIAEFGLGCNDKAVLCGNILQDEKIEGFHWAYGYNAYLDGAIDATDFDSKENLVHEDVIYASGAPISILEIILGNDEGRKVIMRNSRYSPDLGEVFK